MEKSKFDIMKIKVFRTLNKYADISPDRINELLPNLSIQGKLYEIQVLASVFKDLTAYEDCEISLTEGTIIKLRVKGTPINREYPYFTVKRNNIIIGEIFTNVYFSTLSYELRKFPKTISKADCHELDIAMIKPNNTNYININDIIIAVECKHLKKLEKNIIREVLGFRRELSFHSSKPIKTIFKSYPASEINSIPNSIHMFFCSDNRVLDFKDNSLLFGTLMIHYVK
jgi:hypothetical protein